MLHIFVSRAVKITTFGSKMVIFPARNANIYKICELDRRYCPQFTTVRNQICNFTNFN